MRTLLKKITRFKLGGPVRVVVIRKTEDVPSRIRELKRKKEPFFVIGGGTNIIASDKGYKGVILKIETKKLSAKGNIIIIRTSFGLSDFPTT